MKDIAYADVLHAMELLGIDELDAKQVRSVVIEPTEVIVTRLHQVDGKNQLDGDRLVLTEDRHRISYLDLTAQRN